MANPWTAFYWADYDAKTEHLSLVQDGAYRRLLSTYYKTGKPLPANDGILLRICRAFDDLEKAAVTAVLNEFFILEDDGYHNKRADEELQKQTQISEKRRDAGKKGASVTNGKVAANGSANERQMPTQPQPQPQPQPQLQKDLNTKAIFETSPDKAGKFIKPRFTVPDWIAADAWNGYEEMRRQIRKPMTDRARQLAIKELGKLLIRGHPPEEVLNQSTLNCWQGLFEVKSNGSNRAQQQEQQSHDAIANAARRYAARHSTGEADGVGAGAEQPTSDGNRS